MFAKSTSSYAGAPYGSSNVNEQFNGFADSSSGDVNGFPSTSSSSSSSSSS